MVKEVCSINLGAFRLDVTVPDSATEEDEFEMLVYYIKYYKRKASIVRRALEAIKKLAENDANVKALLEEEGFEYALQERAGFYEAIGIELLHQLVQRASADALIAAIGPELFAMGMIKTTLSSVMDELLKKFDKKSQGEGADATGEPSRVGEAEGKTGEEGSET